MNTRLLSTLASLTLAAPTFAQITAFTYQGELKSGGQPANGTFDLKFTLFNAASGGLIMAPPHCVNNVLVTGGKFTATLDFGVSFVTTGARFLEIDVRADTGLDCTNLTGFTTLIPRTPVTPAPSATYSAIASALRPANGTGINAVSVDSIGRVGVGTTTPGATEPGTRLDVVGGPIRAENIGDQADLLWLASERSWVFRQEGTGAGAALKLQSVGGGGNKHFIVQTDGLMGVGTTTPLAKLDVRGDIRLGPSGQFLAPAAEENLRVVRGTVQILGTVFAGSGWTVSHPTTGTYVVTFNTPFASIPTITASPGSAGFSVTQSLSTSAVTFFTRNSSGVSADTSVSFIAAGPR